MEITPLILHVLNLKFQLKIPVELSSRQKRAES